MKSRIYKTLAIIGLICLSTGIYAQVPPPPPGGGHGGTGNQEGGGAPIGSGIDIMIILGALWAGKKVIKLQHDNKDNVHL